MSGRLQGTATQAGRVLRIYRALNEATGAVWFKALAADLGVCERTIRRDLDVVQREVITTHDLVHTPDGRLRLTTRAA